MLNLPTDDRDPDADSYERAPKRSAQEFVNDAAKAGTRDDLLVIFKAAGTAGVLYEQVASPTGEKMTLSEYFGHRGDEINFQSGTSGTGTAPAPGKSSSKR